MLHRMASYDLVVVGGGPAGEKGAVAAAFFGKKVALVEQAEAGPGGATVHTGTLPSKTLRETALYLTGFKRRQLYQGWTPFPEGPHSAQALMCRLPRVRELQSAQIARNLARHQVELVHGQGRFVSPQALSVDGRVLEASHFLIATGSSPRRPAHFDFADPEVFDSDSILELDRMPDSLAVIGGGVIGSEYACVFAALGARIEVVERGERLLGFLDHEVSDALMAAMRREGIVLHLEETVTALRRDGDDLLLSLGGGGQERRVDKVLVSAGRIGNTGELELARAGVEVDERGLVLVDAGYRSSAKHIAAVGDVIGRPALASTAMEQGRLAVAALFGLSVPPRDFSALPSGIYTIPEACSCGPTEEELRQRGLDYVVGRAELRHNARGQIIGDTDGFIKLLFDRSTRRLLGTHIIAERATELIHIGQAVQRLGGGIDYFVETVMSYPSLSMAYKYAAYDALGKLTDGARLPAPLD